MAVILSLDSSGDIFSAAVNRAADKAAAPAVRRDHSNRHAACALPLIRALLAEQGLTLADCDAFAFAAGPGKFSALRLVCAIARTFAYAQHKPLLAVPSFAALAEANYGNQPLTVKCALPAQRQHVYFGVCEYVQEKESWQVKSCSIRRADVAPAIPAAQIGHACGAGYQHYPQLLGKAAFNDTAPYSDAAAVWQLAVNMLKNSQTADPLNCEPIYLRRKVAETIYERQCKQTTSKN